MEEYTDNSINLNTKYSILLCRQLITDLQYLDKLRAPLRPELYETERETLGGIRNNIDKLDQMFKEVGY
jgi:hypothetical protein